MIASRLHNFIFLKTIKTAGTSIELALSAHCGPDDIVAPISKWHDPLLAETGIFPRNFGRADVEFRLVEALRSGDRRTFLQARRENRATGGVHAHSLPRSVRARVSEEFWNGAFKFTSERHPYEKALSLAHFTYRPQKGDFAEHLEATVAGDHRYVGYRWYIVGGKCIVDDVVRHEALQADIDRVAARLGLPKLTLPQARAVERDRTPAKDVLTAEQKAIIYRLCRPEFHLFKWER